MKFQPGDEVIAIEGKYKGSYGKVLDYWIESPVVEFAEDSYVAVMSDEDLTLLDEEDEKSEDDRVIEIPVHEFGISQETFQHHLEFLIGRTLAHVGKVGPEQAFFGFQEFEGKTASEVLLELMMKLEEGMAMFAQAHILIGRIVAALEIVHDQDE